MTVNTARKILNANGVQWSNLFDLLFVIQNTPYEGHEKIIDACQRMAKCITTGD